MEVSEEALFALDEGLFVNQAENDQRRQLAAGWAIEGVFRATS